MVMSSDHDLDPPPQAWLCPQCGQTVQHPENPHDHLLICPSCGHQFFVEQPTQTPTDLEPLVDSPPTDPHQDELDAARIRKHARMRQALYRSRSYALMGLGVCAVGVIHLMIQLLRGAYPPHRIALVWVIILTLLIGTRFFLRKMLAHQRELRNITPPVDPAQPPDFSTLSDGSQRVRNLEKLR